MQKIYFYQGTLEGDPRSKKDMKEIQEAGYQLITKPVKIIRFSINVSSIKKQSTEIIQKLIKRPLLRKLDGETTEFLNTKLEGLNKQGIFDLQDRKCNFDVEMSLDIVTDLENGNADTFILFTGDSDFVPTIERVLAKGKNINCGWNSERNSKRNFHSCRTKKNCYF